MRLTLALPFVLVAGAAAASDVPLPPLVAPKPLPVTPAMALAGYGEVAAGVTRRRAEDSGNTFSGLFTYAGGAYVNLPHGNRWNLELEAHGYRIDWGGDVPASEGGVFAHGYWRDPTHGAIGVFGGASAVTHATTGHMATVGAEALAYHNALTLYGQAAWYHTDGPSWIDFTGYFLRGTVRYFASPNARLQLDVQRSTMDNSDHTVAWTVVGSAEYRHANSALAGFVRARYDYLGPAVNQPYSAITILLGLRGYFGSGTLLDNDRRGAPLDVLPFPPLYALNFG